MGDGSSDTGISVSVQEVFIARGCERRSHVLDWSHRLNKIVFSSAGDLCLATDSPRILQTKATHTHPITCLKCISWLRNYSGPESVDFVISGDAGGAVCLHKISVGEDALQVCSVATYSSSSSQAVTCCAGILLDITDDSSYSTVTAYSPSNGLLHVCWDTFLGDELEGGTSLEFSLEPALALCLAFSVLNDTLVLAVGTSNNNVEVYCGKKEQQFLERLLILRGHVNWITALSFNRFEENSDAWWLASAGQDNAIRLWRFSTSDSEQQTGSEASVSAKLDESRSLVVELEAILCGHEDWVVSVEWHPKKNQILTASADKSLIIWEASEGGRGAWLEKVRVGEVGGQAAGYYGGCFSPDGSVILAVSYFGGFHAWHVEEGEGDTCKPLAVFGGHSLAVCDVSWDPTGSYLLSCSLDQTARCFSPLRSGGHAEIARPQVHGHDFSCIACISPSRYVSGAEEKILRVFQAPQIFAQSLANISGYSLDQVFPDVSCLAEHGASMPALGLSNKQMDNAGAVPFVENAEEDKDIFIAPGVLRDVPTEDCLMQSTLWPEVQKLYGHGFEVFTVASNHAGTLIASACKASQTEHATVLLWDTTEWKRGATHSAHQLTVTQLVFSHDDRMLASVSRDRSFAIFLQSAEDPYDWELLYKSATRGAVHSRIIWSCAWSSDDNYLATVSRDKKLAIWSIDREEREVHLEVEAKRELPVTAVDFCPFKIKSQYAVAIGLENGVIEVFAWGAKMNCELVLLLTLDQSVAHSQGIQRLTFRPKGGMWSSSSSPSEKNVYELASASLDNAVKVYRLYFHSTDGKIS